MRAFIEVLQDLIRSRSSYSLEQWMSHRPPRGQFTPPQEAILIATVEQILQDETAIKGMLVTFRGRWRCALRF